MTESRCGKFGTKSIHQELHAFSQVYRARLSKEGKLEQDAEKVMAGLKQTREGIAANEYR